MSNLSHLLDKNKSWADSVKAKTPDFFKKLSEKQQPKYLWIGCSDSRVPPATITGLNPGDVFVTRNIANLIIHTDFNILSVIQYAVEVLKVKDIIICGHYSCGGVLAAMGIKPYGLADNWLRHIRDVFIKHKEDLLKLPDFNLRTEKLVELNIKNQVHNVCYTNIVQKAWSNQENLAIHGWVFELSTGLIKDLNCTITSPKQIEDIYHLNI